MTDQEQFEADYLASLATEWPKGCSTDFGRTDRGYQMPVIDNMFRVWQREAADACLEKASFLRAYADLSRKWQAVLDAEPLGILVNVPGEYLVTWGEQAMLKSYQGTCQLIIKPTA